jgi:release factor glutamine methyltransferase
VSQTIGGALRDIRDALRAVLPDADADREARMLLGHVTGRSQARLISDLAATLTPNEMRGVDDALAARQSRQPLSQIIGSTEFYGRRFRVTRDVLTPRSDTETLIDIALSARFERVLDLGTGSGCILATLLVEHPEATGFGTDVSEAALDVAAQNIAQLGLAERAELRTSDWFENVEGQFDLIVSNPPYIAADEMAGLAPDVREWEPHLALTPGDDGLSAYRAILDGMPSHLRQGGRVMVEVGFAQGAAVSALFRDAGLAEVACHPDLSGNDRIVSGRWP